MLEVDFGGNSILLVLSRFKAGLQERDLAHNFKVRKNFVHAYVQACKSIQQTQRAWILNYGFSGGGGGAKSLPPQCKDTRNTLVGKVIAELIKLISLL